MIYIFLCDERTCQDFMDINRILPSYDPTDIIWELEIESLEGNVLDSAKNIPCETDGLKKLIDRIPRAC